MNFFIRIDSMLFTFSREQLKYCSFSFINPFWSHFWLYLNESMFLHYYSVLCSWYHYQCLAWWHSNIWLWHFNIIKYVSLYILQNPSPRPQPLEIAFKMIPILYPTPQHLFIFQHERNFSAHVCKHSPNPSEVIFWK